MGKTRLAVRVASDLHDAFDGQVFFVDLAPVSDPVLVVPTIARSLGIKETNGKALESLGALIGIRPLLLLLDNFEQVESAAGSMAALLAMHPGLKMIVTTRAPLRLSWEHECPVMPLVVPDLRTMPPIDALTACPSVALFINRAGAVQPDFEVTAQNAAVIAEVCVRLDGLPLAIELAAARIKLLPPHPLLRLLRQRLRLLTAGARDIPVRHQTLRNAIAWSYGLLRPDEQALFRRLAVFVGGFTLEAVAAVGGNRDAPPADEVDTLDVLGSLVDNNLVYRVVQPDGEPRYRMLETLREYGFEQLIRGNELRDARRRHAEYFLALAGPAAGGMPLADGTGWLERLEIEHDNLHAAMGWFQDNGETAVVAQLKTVVGDHETFAVRSNGDRAVRQGVPSEHRLGALTIREQEVAALVARGCSNREIARVLFITERTAATHVQHILNKLGFDSRARIAAWAVEHGLGNS